MKLKVCDISLDVNNEIITLFEEKFQKFMVLEENQNDKMVEVKVEQQNKIEFPKSCFKMTPFSFGYGEDGRLNAWNTYSDSAKIIFEKGYNKTSLYITKGAEEKVISNMLLLTVNSNLCMEKGFFIHGAVVEYQQEGMIFTASPGVGKSTHAQIWKEMLGASIINGDKAFVKLTNKGALVYGSPWSGSSNYAENKKVPLKGIIILEQGKKNHIRKATSLEVATKLTTHIYYPYWDKGLVLLALKTIEDLLEKCPVYVLTCKPDGESVMAVREELYGTKI